MKRSKKVVWGAKPITITMALSKTTNILKMLRIPTVIFSDANKAPRVTWLKLNK